MSQVIKETNEDSDLDSSNDSSRLSSSETTTNNSGADSTSTISETDSSVSGCCVCSNPDSKNDLVCRLEMHDECLEESKTTAAGDDVKKERSNVLRNRRDDLIHRSQSTTGCKCDTVVSTSTQKTSCSNDQKFDVSIRDRVKISTQPDSMESYPCPSTSYPLNCSNRKAQSQVSGSTLQPMVPTSSFALDTNNNKNSNNPMTGTDCLSTVRRCNYSKSASGSRLVHKNNAWFGACDCLSKKCLEEGHSSRRQFIENYYNSKTRLPSSMAMSALNISSPLDRLSECDAITKRLLSSPIRGTNLSESTSKRTQISEVEKLRRASLDANTLTDQVSLFSSNQFNSLEASYGKSSDNSADTDQEACDSLTDPVHSSREGDTRFRQPHGRSLSVCQEESLKPQFRNTNSGNSTNLNRAVSLACESSTSRCLLTIIPLFGCDIKALEQFMKIGLVLPPAIDSAIDHILTKGIDAIGIFRKSGVKSRIMSLRQRIEANQDSSLSELNQDDEFSIYDIADLVKMWFRELKPMPIMTQELIRIISEFSQTSGVSKDHETTSQEPQCKSSNNLELHAHLWREQSNNFLKQKIDSLTSPTHKALLSKALNFFASVSSNSEINQMTSQNLAICLTPSLCATNPDQKSIIVAQKALKYCIDNYRILF